MNDFYNLDGIVDMQNFPWEEIKLGIAKSTKKASIFYGYNTASDNPGGLEPEQVSWYKAIKNKESLKGMDILLSTAKTWRGAWYKLGYRDCWMPTENLVHFPLLLRWIKDSDIFREIGRLIIFIQLQGSCTPEHVDENFDRIPAEYKKIPEFIWITEQGGKRLFVNNTQAGNVVWFNSFVPHSTAVEDGVRWSLRIDGIFTEEFKTKLKI